LPQGPARARHQQQVCGLCRRDWPRPGLMLAFGWLALAFLEQQSYDRDKK
jgi:hypothetical protein